MELVGQGRTAEIYHYADNLLLRYTVQAFRGKL